MKKASYSNSLQKKIETLKAKTKATQVGQQNFSSKLILAPMASITNSPFRILMQELGSGGSISELISCHGINYKNEKTHKLLKIGKDERNVGIQLFGEDAGAMKEAAIIAEGYNADFIDINMGCPVRKVVNKGGGSALLKEPLALASFLKIVKAPLKVPLTIKIRTGWDESSINAKEIIHIAHNEGVDFVSVHGRTRAQQYKGKANWQLLEQLGTDADLPVIGNGDLHHENVIISKLENTSCSALMLGRGPLRNPFLFLTPFLDVDSKIRFSANDYLQVIERYAELFCDFCDRERTQLVQVRKIIIWFASGFSDVAQFRTRAFAAKTLDECLRVTREYFLSIPEGYQKFLSVDAVLSGGHG